MREMKIPEKAPQSGALWLLIVTYAAVGFSIWIERLSVYGAAS